MPRVTLYEEKYIESDAVAFIEGKTRETRQKDKDIAAIVGLSPQAYSKRKKKDKMDFSYIELVRMFRGLNLTDEEISNIMKGNIGRNKK